jgi:hypothetical protein
MAIPLIISVILCFEGGIWQKFFANLCVVNNSVLIGYIVSPIAQMISPYGTDSFFLWQIIFMTLLYAVELILICKFLINFFSKLFEIRGKIWILFTAGTIVSRLILRLCIPDGSYIAVTTLPEVGRNEIYDYYLVIFASAMFVLEIENNYSGDLQEKDGKLISTKENGGQGIKSIELICEKYNGEFITKFTEEKFTALILLNR